MFLLVLMLIGMLLETVGLGLIIPAVGLLTQPDGAVQNTVAQWVLTWRGEYKPADAVTAGMLLLIALYVVKTAFLGFLAFQQTKFAFGVQADVSRRLFSLYLGQPYAVHIQRNSAQLLRNCTAEITVFGSALLAAMYLLTEGLISIGIAVLLVAIEPAGALVVVSLLGGAAWMFHRATRSRMGAWGRQRQVHEGQRVQYLQQGFGGVKEAKLLGREGYFLSAFAKANRATAFVAHRQNTMTQLPRLWMELLAVAGLATLVFIMMAQGRDMSAVVPTLGLFAAAAFRLSPSANRLLSAAQTVRFGYPAVQLLAGEFAAAKQNPPCADDGAIPFGNEIRLDAVTFAYAETRPPALRDVSMTILKNESVGVIGASGSGKTTLVDVLLGLLSPTLGKVLVDGSDVQQHVSGWQRQIGYVPQSIFLTDDTIRRNIAFGVEDTAIDEAAIARAVRASQLDAFVESLPEGLETLVGERGVRLSGGQRQRIGIARALYTDPAVLVLDEATSALDTATEKGVMEAVSALRGSRTLIIVAHRASTVSQCDRIIRLEGGRITASGSPVELLAVQGVG